jgi:4a-hydroxytetrahydrobiopterin dehydratase
MMERDVFGEGRHGMTEEIGARQFLRGAKDWRITSDGACAFFATRSFDESVRFVQAIGQQAGLDGFPDVDIRANGVTVRLVTVTDDLFGLSTRDLAWAQGISSVARERGLRADPAKIQSFLLIVGSHGDAAVLPFWEAVLGYRRRPDSPDEDLIDPADRGPSLWFEQMEEPRGDGGGAIHVGIWLPPEQAEARVAAALAAGGRMVRDNFAPSWWTLADAAGNEACIGSIGSIEGREGPPPQV